MNISTINTPMPARIQASLYFTDFSSLIKVETQVQSMGQKVL